jgi:hypothetical protein
MLVCIIESDKKKLVCIYESDQKVGMNITVWSNFWYVYYGLIKKLEWLLQGDQ